MNILIICDRLDNSCGGLEQYVIAQSNGLAKNNNVLLCANSIGQGVIDVLNKDIILHNGWNQTHWNATKYDIEKTFNEKFPKPDIIHCHPFSAYDIGYQMAMYFNCKLFASHHGLYTTGFGNDPFGRSFSNKITKVFPVDHIAEYFLDKHSICPKQKMEVLYNSVDINRLKDINPINLNLDINKKTLVAVTRLGDNKEVPLKQLINISDKFNCNILIVGGGIFEDEIRKLTANKSNIIMTGAVTNPQDYMAIADLCLCSARTAIEAIILGKNVIQMGIGKWGEFITYDNYKDTVFNTTKYADYSNESLYNLIIKSLDQEVDINLKATIEKNCNINHFINTLEKNYGGLNG